jgi:hypothetical protein
MNVSRKKRRLTLTKAGMRTMKNKEYPFLTKLVA